MSFPLRPHHGLCLMYFTGKGYSEAFTANLSLIAQKLYDAPKHKIRLVCRCDHICSVCPSCENGHCIDGEKVESYDRRVLRLCGLQEEEELSFMEFQRKISRYILTPGLRESVCEGCSWNGLCAAVPPKTVQEYR